MQELLFLFEKIIDSIKYPIFLTKVLKTEHDEERIAK